MHLSEVPIYDIIIFEVVIRKVIVQLSNDTYFIITFDADCIIKYVLIRESVVMNLCVRYQKCASTMYAYVIGVSQMRNRKMISWEIISGK